MPHLDIVEPADILAYPFYGEENADSHGVTVPDATHRTFWLDEPSSALVFTHMIYWRLPSFIDAAAGFALDGRFPAPAKEPPGQRRLGRIPIYELGDKVTEETHDCWPTWGRAGS